MFKPVKLKYEVVELELGGFVPESVLLTDEDRALLVKVSNLLEELVETFSILEDKQAMSCLKRAERDVKAGRVREYDDFFRELKEAGEV